MEPLLHSPKYGELYLMEDTDPPVYSGELSTTSSERISFSVHCLGENGSGCLDEVEARVSWLVDHEPQARQILAVRALEDLAEYWGDREPPPSQEFAESLRLTSFNCFPNHSYECWYETPLPTEGSDFVGEFDEDFRCKSVYFDG